MSKGFRTEEMKNRLFQALNVVVTDEGTQINPDGKDITFICFDTETSGLNPIKDYILQLSAQKYKVNPNSIEVIGEFDSYLNWGSQLTVNGTEAAKVNNITDEMLAEAPPALEVMQKWEEFIEGIEIFAGYNSNFDIKFINGTNNRLGLGEFAPATHLDVWVMTKDCVEAPSHKLIDMATYFDVEKDIDFHNSLADVIATERVMECCIEEYGIAESLNKLKPKGFIKPFVKRLNYWKGYRGFSRIYITTDVGEFYYDIRNKCYGMKPNSSAFDIDEIDMEALREATLAKAGAKTDEELARYR